VCITVETLYKGGTLDCLSRSMDERELCGFNAMASNDQHEEFATS
jgi:hypothetical protein